MRRKPSIMHKLSNNVLILVMERSAWDNPFLCIVCVVFTFSFIRPIAFYSFRTFQIYFNVIFFCNIYYFIAFGWPKERIRSRFSVLQLNHKHPSILCLLAWFFFVIAVSFIWNWQQPYNSPVAAINVAVKKVFALSLAHTYISLHFALLHFVVFF